MKWTQTDGDIRHLCETSERLWKTLLEASFQICIQLNNDTELRGRFSGTHAANNGGQGGHWQYCETITLELEDGRRVEIDLLDVRFIVPAR